MDKARRVVLTMSLLLGPATVAAAQAPAKQPRWDAAVVTGLFLAHPEKASPDRYGDDWTHAAAVTLSASRYWSTHLKTEAEFTLSGEGRQYVTTFVQVPGLASPVPVSSEQHVSVRGVSAAVAWQFLENQWVHPFVFGGAGLDFDRSRIDTFPQTYYSGNPPRPVVVERARTGGPRTVQHLRGVVGLGAKTYVTPRAFIRTDARVGIGRDSGHIQFRIGGGVDF